MVGLLAVVFALATAANLATVYGWLVRKKTGSLIPLIGGAAGAVACLLLPPGGLHDGWFLPLLVDPGAGLLFTLTSALIVRQLFRPGGNPD